MKIYEDFETIIQPGKPVDAVYLIDNAHVNVIDSTGLFVLTVLKKYSFFGEYQVLHSMGSPFEYRIDSALDESESDQRT